MNRQISEEFRAVKILCTIIISVIAYDGGYVIIYICLNPWSIQHQEWTLNYSLWVTIMCQCRFILGKKGTALLSGVDEAVHVWGRWVCRKSLYLPLRFITSLKLLWKIKSSLVAQWLRICLPMQGTRVRALVQEDPTCRGATKPVRHNYWACALEPTSHNYWAHVPQVLKPMCPEPVLRQQEKPPQWVAPARRN